MRRILLALVLSLPLLAQDHPSLAGNPYVPKNMKQYFVGFLVKPEAASSDKARSELAGLLQQHLRYIKSQVKAGKYLVVGPLLDDSRMAGLVFIDVSTAEEAKRILDADPMVLAGKLKSEVHPAMLPDLSRVTMDYPETVEK
jgi:uncharacterized protein YciI